MEYAGPGCHGCRTQDDARPAGCDPVRYFTEAASRVEICRGPMVPYFIQDVRAALLDSEQPPQYQIIVANLAEVKPWLWMPSKR